MHIAVVSHSITDFYFTPQRASALGAESIAALLELRGHTVSRYNFSLGQKQDVPIPKELGYLKPLIISGESGATSFFSTYRRFGPAPTDAAAKLLAPAPDAVWISCFAYAYRDDAAALAEEIRLKDRDIPIVLGGAGLTVAPESFSIPGVIDIAVAGEAEPLIDDILLLQENLRNSQDRNRTLGIEEKSGEWFYPSVTHLSPYRNRERIVLSITRGCPKRCSFCSNHLTHGRNFRLADAKLVRELFDRIKPDPEKTLHIAFEDDNLLLARDYFFALLDYITYRFPKASFSAENGMDYLHLNRERIDKLIAYGFTQFNLSAGSFSSRALLAAERPYQFDKLKEILGMIKARGGYTILYFISGLSGDTGISIAETLARTLALPADIGISPFYAVPGLPGFETGELKANFCKGSSLYPWNNSLSAIEQVTAFRLARLVNLLKHPDRDRELSEKILREQRLHTRIRGEVLPVAEEKIDLNMCDKFFSMMCSWRTHCNSR